MSTRGSRARSLPVLLGLVALFAWPLACTSRDVVAIRGGDAGADASSDAGFDSGFDAGLDPVTNCPGPVTLPGSATPCSAAFAAQSFPYGVCSCVTGINSSVDFEVDAFDSRIAPHSAANANLGGSIGNNGASQISGTFRATGDFHTWGPAGLTLTGAANVHIDGSLVVRAPFVDDAMGSTTTVLGDVTVGGALQLGTLEVFGVLHRPIGSNDSLVTNLILHAGRMEGSVDPQRPCPCPTVAGSPYTTMVTAASTMNENAAIGLAMTALAATATPTTLTLPCGRYYLTAIAGTSTATLHATGHAAVFVAGDVDVSTLVVSLDPGASLDLFVDGDLRPDASWQLGDATRPSAFRLYVGGSGTIVLPTGSWLAGLFAAPQATVSSSAPITIHGAVEGWSLDASASFHVHEDLARAGLPSTCSAP